MDPSLNFRQKYIAQGAHDGYLQALEETLEKLDAVIDTPDPELAMQDFRAQLTGRIDQARSSSPAAASTTTVYQSQAAQSHTSGGDLGDRVVAAMQARRSGKVDPGRAIADAQVVGRQQAQGDIGDQVVSIMRQRRGLAGAL